jgi:hypothetical protein
MEQLEKPAIQTSAARHDPDIPGSPAVVADRIENIH